MKKIFTLLAAVFLAGNAFGQQVWTNIATNSDFEGDNEGWDSFIIHEWKVDDMSAQYDGPVAIAEDPDDPSNKCAKIYVRSADEATEAGNMTMDWKNEFANWDTQFFVYAQEPIPQGKMVRLKFRIKGEKAGSFELQRQKTPGGYIDGMGNQTYDTEWKTITTDPFTVSESLANNGFQSFAFNLTNEHDGNTVYLDDIKMQIKDPKEEGEVSWINFMRKGIYSDDAIKGIGIVDGKETPFECSNFTIQTPEQQKAPIVEVPGEAGEFAVLVPVPGYVVEEVEDLDADGNEQLDDDGNVKTKNVYKWNDGSLVGGDGASKPARWNCQFFVSTLHKMKTGERYRFMFRVKADKPSALGTQAHYGPGQYKDYNTFGDESAFPVTTDWTVYELGEAQNQTVPSGANGCQTITFDCVPLEGPDNNFYFIFEECSFTDAYVTDADRTLGDHEKLVLPVNTDEDELATTIDASGMLNTFEVADFKFLENETDGIKLFSQTVPEDPEDDPEDTFSGLLPWTDGGFVGADGYYRQDLTTGVSLRFDDTSVKGNNVDILVWNDPNSGITFGDGETLETQLAVSQSGWYYVYDVTLMNPQDYEKYLDELAGIKTIVVKKNTSGVIYDLMGRKVSQPTKGIYIKDGKKFIQK